MKNLMRSCQTALSECDQLPFSVYTSLKEQRIVNVPILQPVLICVLDGCKHLGNDADLRCPAGSFVFLSNSPQVDMRNIPDIATYFALLIPFEFADFSGFTDTTLPPETYVHGPIDDVLATTLEQFVTWTTSAPATLWPSRRQEILHLLYHSGYPQISTAVEPPSLSQQLHQMISANVAEDLSARELSSALAMSESTLRRKLQAEGTHLQALKDRARLGHGLHLIQTTQDPIGRIAEQCGYLSQSRFTDKFKQRFGITPTALRSTRMRD
ncbi:MAG TPA: AraC family transcriptional regulator [Gammaproteobacteria bacterium]|jgi:AraC-like DNA-binding protein|nr:AraC family transcriptional regulator [Gammaproteobacteria bacterium]